MNNLYDPLTIPRKPSARLIVRRCVVGSTNVAASSLTPKAWSRNDSSSSAMSQPREELERRWREQQQRLRNLLGRDFVIVEEE